MKVFSITVNASPRYPIRETYQIEASGWSTAIARAIREYFRKHKHMRSEHCSVSAYFVSRRFKEGK